MTLNDFSAADLIGSVIDGRFELVDKLGEGGMGVIFKARQLSMERMVAVKILLRNRRGDPISVERFRHEAYLASRLRHPNAVVIYDFGQSGDGLLYIAMELLAGENLKQHIKGTGAMPVAKALKIIRQTLRPISQAHRMGLIHRDLKPANIFLTKVEKEDDFAKVLDFGVAKLTAVHEGVEEGYKGGLTVAGKIYGTPNYMSPEQIRGKELDNQSDLYSLGVILYEMLAGRRPFEGETPVDVMMMHLRDEPRSLRELRPELPVELDAVVMKALAKERADRYASGEEFLEALQQFETGISSEHGAWGSQEVPTLGAESEASLVLSGIDLEGLDDFDDLEEEKTILDSVNGALGDEEILPDVEDVDEDEQRTVMERVEDLGDLDLDGSVADLLPHTGPVEITPKPDRSEEVTEVGKESSILELPSAEFEQLDPSRLIDIPRLDESVKRTKPSQGRRTVLGQPGTPLNAHVAAREDDRGSSQEKPRPSAFPSAPTGGAIGSPKKTMPSERYPSDNVTPPKAAAGPESTPTLPRLESTRTNQPPQMSSKPLAMGSREGAASLAQAGEPRLAARPKAGATAFQLPESSKVGRRGVEMARRNRGRSKRWILLLLSLSVIGVGGYFGYAAYIKEKPKKKKKSAGPTLNLLVSDDATEVFVDGLKAFPGKPFSLVDASEEIIVTLQAQGSSFDVPIARGSGSINIFVQLSSNESVQEVGKLVYGEDVSGEMIIVDGDLVGKAPLVFIGPKGKPWQVQVGDAGEAQTKMTE